MYQILMNQKNWLLLLLLIVITTVANSELAGAADWSDTSSNITMSHQNLLPQAPSASCGSYFRQFAIDGESEEKKVCVASDSGRLIFGYYHNGSQQVGVIGSVSDGQLYQLLGCVRTFSCLYIGSLDMLFVKNSIANFPQEYRLNVYKDVSRHLQKMYSQPLKRMVYQLDTQSSDLGLKNQHGQVLSVNGVAASNNEQWMVAEVRHHGFVVIHLETMEFKHITQKTLGYGYGMNPTPELAISNDGSVIAIAGLNVGPSVIVNTNSCGKIVYEGVMHAGLVMEASCKERQLPVWQSHSDFSSAHFPVFDDNSDQLRLYVTTKLGNVYREVFRADDRSFSRLMYLSIGDSYTSGEGELSDDFYQRGTNSEYGKCHLSSRSYPYLVGVLLDYTDASVKNVACSSATLDDIVGSEVSYWGQGNRLAETTLGLSLSERLSQQQAALSDFVPGLVHQEKFVDLYQPLQLTIGVAGNDVGLMEKLKTCLMLDTCEWASSQQRISQTGSEIEAIYSKLVALYQRLQNTSPASSLYAVGYPQIIDSDGECGWLGVLLSTQERLFISRSITKLNYVIASAAAAAKIPFVDVSEVFDEHQLCRDGKAMNSIKIGDDIAISSDIQWLKLFGNESFHPTPFGHQLLSKKVTSAILSGLSDTAPVPDSNYWKANNDLRSQSQAELVSGGILEEGSTVQLQLPVGTFEPNSLVTVSIHSEPTELGKFQTTDGGGLQAMISLPTLLGEGFHTIHILGNSYSGAPVDLYQVVQYGIIHPEQPGGDEPDHAQAEPDEHEEPKEVVEEQNSSKSNDDEVSSVSTALAAQENSDSLVKETDGQLLGATNVPSATSKGTGLSSVSDSKAVKTDALATIQHSREVGEDSWTIWLIVGVMGVAVIILFVVIYRHLDR